MATEIDELTQFRPTHLAWPLHVERLSRLSSDEAVAYLRARKSRIIEAESDPLRCGYTPRIWDVVREQIAELRKRFPQGVVKIIIWGGHRCLRGDTMIYDPVAKISKRVDEIDYSFHVYSWDGDRIVISEASRPFTKGKGRMLRVTMSNGVSFVAADTHRVFSSQKEWISLSRLKVGSSLFLPVSTLELSQLIHISNGRSFSKTELGSPIGYPSERHLYGGLLHEEEGNALYAVPLQDDAPKRISVSGSIRRWLWRLYCRLPADIPDGLDKILSRNPVGSRYDRRAILDDLRLIAALLVGILYRAFYKPYISVSASRDYLAFGLDSLRSEFAYDLPESMPGFYQPDKRHHSCASGEAYITSITEEGIDVKWDFTVTTGNYIHGGVIHHNSSKTRFASNHVLDDIVKNPGHRWWCCDSTEAMARTNQMRLLWEQMPNEWKNLERDQVTDIRYSVSDGFPKNKFVTPTASEVEFKFYSIDVKDLPGPEIDGIWGDELMPLDWVKFAMFRLVNRNGIFILTFTPEFGWNETIQHFYEGAQIIEETEAPLLPKYGENGEKIGHRSVPRIMQCADPSARIIFFHTADNPFGNYPGLVQELAGKSEEEILIRAYGVCTKSHSAAFPLFSKRVHVISEAAFAVLLKEHPRTMRFHLVDPCDGRNWFQIWVACPCPDRWIIYREWPSHGHPKAYIEGIGHIGPWALSGAAADGVMGSAQKSFGFSLKAYVDEILRQENGEPIAARYIDSRYATARRTDYERVTTLQEQLGECGMDFLAMTPESRILGAKDGSIDMINSALYYDAETDVGQYSAKLGRLNEPQLQILETCPNTIYSLEHWTGKDGQKGACKDPVDCVRGLFLSSVNYMDENMYSFTGGGIR